MKPEPSPMVRLAEAERLLGGVRVLVPRLHVALSAVVAVAVWFVPDTAVRWLAVADALVVSLVGVAVARTLSRDAWVYSWLDEVEDDDADAATRPSARAYAWGLAGSFAAASAIGVSVVVLVPVSWLPYLLTAAALFALWSGWRQDREVRAARLLRERSVTEPWYAEYRAMIEERRREVSGAVG
ncbi:hypothetical protein ABZX40_30730 [Streptomyces sp. NPDC004610]|uniref:hypothetical protein n=1 Tax=unclassified Streptomyces TaxID=2593676 RepID=UPI0033B07BBC